MGNQNAKGIVQKLYTADELKVLEAAFRAASSSSDKCTKEKLLENWSQFIDPYLAQCTSNYLFTGEQHSLPSIGLMRFAEPYYIVERGTIDDKLNLLVGSMEKTGTNEIAMKEMEKYVTAVFRSYLHMLAHQTDAAYKSWEKCGYQTSERTILAFAKGIIRSLTSNPNHVVEISALEQWLQVNPTFLIMWREVYAYLYSKAGEKAHKWINNSNISGSTSSPDRNLSNSTILPMSEGIPQVENYTPILDIPHVIFANSHLPHDMRHKWRFLFSSKIMGESFSTMLGKILNRGPTLLILEDEDRYIFSGYAPTSWALRPNFVGDDTSALLTLSPAMRCFGATGYNDHYQYLNMNQQTMPNGLGMGGQFHYWGLWVDSSYGLGQSSQSCTTYRDYMQLSKRKDFKIRNLEVWGIGDEPKLDDDDDEEEGPSDRRKTNSVLDSNLEDRVMLELAGKQMHSDGLREPEMDL